MTALGLERVGVLKKTLARLDAAAEDIADEELRKVTWGHDPAFEFESAPTSLSNPFRTYRPAQILNYVEEVLRHIRGRPGPALVEAGLAGPDRGRARYPYGMDWSKDMGQAMSDYADAFDDLHRAVRARREAELAKARAQAEDLWEQA